MENKIILTKSNNRDYLTTRDAIENCRQIVEINQSSTLEFSLNKSSDKWAYFEGSGLEAECNNRVYCVWGEDSVTRSRDSSGTHLPVKLKEIWYKLERQYITAYNINISASSEFDHIDTHMVVLLGNSPDALYINGSKVTCPYTVGTAKYMFWCVLYGTGWTLDTRFDAYWPDGVFDLETDKKNRLENIKLLQSLYGGMLFWDSKNMRMALVDETKYQVYDGYEIRYARNQIGIERKENRDIITRLYPYGNSHLNIAAVNGGKEYIDNFTYTTEILEGIVPHSDIYTQESLFTWGKRQSALYAKPRYTYAVDILKYGAESQAEAQPELGKLAKVIDPDIAPEPTLQRVLKTDQNVFVEHDCKIAVGDVLNTFEGTFKDIEKNAGKAGSTISGIGRIPGISIWGGIPQLDKSNLYWNGIIDGINSTVSDMRGNISSLSQTASSISLRVSNAEGNISSLSITANNITSRVSNLEGYTSTITQSADRIALIVNSSGIRSAEIVASINSAGSSVLISADKIRISGSTTFSNWIRSGTTYIDGGQIYTGSITANQIASNAITSSEIASNAITSAKIASSAITADKIASNAITADKINAGAITSTKIAAGAITAEKIAAGAISASSITTGTLSAARISSSSSYLSSLYVSTAYVGSGLRMDYTGTYLYLYVSGGLTNLYLGSYRMKLVPFGSVSPSQQVLAY